MEMEGGILKFRKIITLMLCLCLTILIGMNTVFASNKKSVNLIKSDMKISTIIWQQKFDPKNEKTLMFDLNKDKKNDIIKISMDHPNGTLVRVIIKNFGVNLLDDSTLYNNEMIFDEFGDLNENFYLQIGLFDFDKDNKQEIIVAAGDGSIVLGASIFKYTGKKEHPYKEIGYIEGQEFINITKEKTIEVPFGSQGLYSEYKIIKGTFKEVNPD